MGSNGIGEDVRDGGGIGELLERSDGRYKFVQLDGERCLSSLVTVGRQIGSLQTIPPEQTGAYLAALDEINDHYFEAREFEREVRGKFYRYDETAEQRFRSAIVEELSNCAERLHRLLAAHEALVETVASATENKTKTQRGGKREETTALCRHTNYAIRAGWYPIVEAYDHSLDPGEKIAEGKRRRRQRLYGQEGLPGIARLLDTPLFEQVSADDLTTVRELDRFTPSDTPEIARRLMNRHPWLLAGGPSR